MIPLYFLQPELKKPVKIVRIGLSGLGADVHYRLGEKIAETARGLAVVSSSSRAATSRTSSRRMARTALRRKGLSLMKQSRRISVRRISCRS